MIAAPATVSVPRAGSRRVWIGLLIAVVGIGSVFYAPAFALLVEAVAIGCLWELGKLAESKGVGLEFTVAALASTAYIALTFFGIIGRYEGDLLSVTVVAALATATFLERGHQLMRSAFTLLGVLYIGKLISYFVAIRDLPGTGTALTVMAILVIAMTDIAAMAVGTTLGRTPLTPLSPRKTVEGALGGLVVASLVGAVCTLFVHWPWWEGLIVGAVTSFAAQAGDVIESAFKRDAKVKDAGSAIAGHGGVLDRFDSYLFGGIAFYCSLFVFHVTPSALP
ncbi:MAG: phosphatidate cytidylyltransferase [Candidatus Velthaea sp.]